MNARAGGTRRAVAMVALAVLLVFAAIPAGGASAARNGTWVGPTSAREASDFWTVARMRAAKPLELNHSAPDRAAGRCLRRRLRTGCRSDHPRIPRPRRDLPLARRLRLRPLLGHRRQL